MEYDTHKQILIQCDTQYPMRPPYHPDQLFPEYPWKSLPNTIEIKEKNDIYRSVREFFRISKFDISHYGSKSWNPIGDLVKFGESVLIKPNWVSHLNLGSLFPENILDCLITHTSLIRAVIDFVYLAVGKNGRIILADAPIQSTDFSLLLQRAHIPELLEFYQSVNINVEVIDFRQSALQYDSSKKKFSNVELSGDPNGYVTVQVDNKSAFSGLENGTFQPYGNFDYDFSKTQKQHLDHIHRYNLSRTALESALIINLPKLKTHSKAGMTGALKNIVGIVGDKSYLPHFRLGGVSEGGDAYPVANKWLKIKAKYSYLIIKFPDSLRKLLRPLGKFLVNNQRIGKDTLSKDAQTDPYLTQSGGWYGNDTVWRMVIDLNIALHFSDLQGVLRDVPRREWLTIIDAITIGEGEGPLRPTPKHLGYLIGGFSPEKIDLLCAYLMGFDWRKIPMLAKGAKFLDNFFPLIESRDHQGLQNSESVLRSLRSQKVVPPLSWRGHIELLQEVDEYPCTDFIHFSSSL